MIKKNFKRAIALTACLMLAAPVVNVNPVIATAYADEIGNETSAVIYTFSEANEYGSTYLEYSTYGSKVEIYKDDVLISTRYSDTEYDSEKEEYVYVNDYINDSYYVGDLAYGKTYTYKLIAYDSNSIPTEPRTVSLGRKWPTVSNSEVYKTTYTSDIYGKYTGYGKRMLVYSLDYSDSYYKTVEVYRSTKKSSGYKKIGTKNAYSDLYYYDETAQPGKTYYYKSRIVSKEGKKVSYGKYTPVVSYKYEKIDLGCYVYFNDKMQVEVAADTSSEATFYEFYRSEKPNSGYKKIATNTTANYVDKKVKSGKTYYYKVKPVYYNQKTGKKEAGNLSKDFSGIKILATPLNITYKYNNTKSATLKWDKIKGFGKYEIYMKTSITGDAYKKVGVTNKNSYKIKNISNNYNYNIYVKAVKSGKVSSFVLGSANINAASLTVPNVESSIASKSIGSKSAVIKYKIKWDYCPAAKSIEIRAYDNKKGDTVTIKKIKGNKAGSYIFKKEISADGSSRYGSVYVVGVNGDNESSAYVYLDTAMLAKVKGIKITKVSETKDKITWSKVKNATGYRVWVNRLDRCYVTGYSTEKNSIEISALSPGVEYIYSVYAVNNKYDISGESGEKKYAHKIKAAKIVKLENSWNGVSINFENLGYAKTYKIMRATSKKGKYTVVGTVNGTENNWDDTRYFTDTKVKAGKTYYYKIVVSVVNDLGKKQTVNDSAVKSIKYVAQ